MGNLTLDLPSMYGDHHVLEVRRILLEMPGVEEVHASSAFHVVEVSFDPALIDAGAITARLDEAGYLDSLAVPLESSATQQAEDQVTYFRHTAAYRQTGRTMSFAQIVSYTGRPLWPCPGMGPVSTINED